MQIKEYFCELIGSTIEASVRSVRAFVREYLVSHSWLHRLSRFFPQLVCQCSVYESFYMPSLRLTTAVPTAGGNH